MSRHLREKTVSRRKNHGYIIKFENISAIYNNVDYYVLFDESGNFVERSIDYNRLHSKLFS